MKKISLLISLVLCVTIGSVYATWVYTQTDDVADINHSTPVNLTEATFEGTYGTYSVDASGLTLTVDPKAGTTHVTSLKITGDLKIHFTPSQYAPVEVKENGVDSTFQFGAQQ